MLQFQHAYVTFWVCILGRYGALQIALLFFNPWKIPKVCEKIPTSARSQNWNI